MIMLIARQLSCQGQISGDLLLFDEIVSEVVKLKSIVGII